MDQQQGKCNNADILDFSTLQSDEATNLVNNTEAWLFSATEDRKTKELQGKSKGFLGDTISEEELKIRSEAEIDIERDLEEEIKDGICHLALRLHRLYQDRKDRRSSAGGDRRKSNNETAFCEVNINIKMEGGTKIEIKETKKAAPEKSYRPPTPNKQPVEMMASNSKKFDWAKTLRSSAGPVLIPKRSISGDYKLWKV